MTRLALFDCDGTLLDSAAAICAAMETAFDRSAIAPPPRDAIRRIVGLSLVEAVAVLLPDADDAMHRIIAADYKLAFQGARAAGEVAEPLFEGIAEALATLTERGWLLGVATGKSDRGLALALAQHGLSDRFVTLQTADRHPSKPHPAMARAAIAEAGVNAHDTIVIGDTSYDMEMATNAGACAIGVTWGYHEADELTKAGAQLLVARPGDLPDLMETL